MNQQMPPNSNVTSDDYLLFLTGLLSGSRSQCADLMASYLNRGIPILDIYVRILQRALYDIGRKWEMAEITVATEHIATALAENLLGMTYPMIFQSKRVGKKAIIACVKDEYHQIGAKMVADVFEMAGWDGVFIGASTPPEELASVVESHRPDVVGLSVSIDSQLPDLDRCLANLRKIVPHLRIMVGGQALMRMPDYERSHRYDAEFIPSIVELSPILGLTGLPASETPDGFRLTR